MKEILNRALWYGIYAGLAVLFVASFFKTIY
jgi:hypothetical protein